MLSLNWKSNYEQAGIFCACTDRHMAQCHDCEYRTTPTDHGVQVVLPSGESYGEIYAKIYAINKMPNAIIIACCIAKHNYDEKL